MDCFAVWLIKKIEFKDFEISSLKEDEISEIRRKDIGIVFQSFYLIPNYTAIENVSLALEINKIQDPINKAKEILTEKIDDLHKIAKALITYETLTGEEIENIINKNIYPADKQSLKAEDDKGSAFDAMGLKPKIVH